MSMKKIYVIIGVILLAAMAWAGWFYYQNLRGIKPIVTQAPVDIAEIIDSQATTATSTNATDFPLKLPAGFKIEVLAKDLSGARDLELDGRGNLWVSRTGQGIVSQVLLRDGQFVA